MDRSATMSPLHRPTGTPAFALRRGRSAALACVVAAAVVAPAQAQQPPPGSAAVALPVRNLVVEVRQSDQAQGQERGGGLDGGSVVIRSDGRAQGSAGVTLQSRSQSRTAGVTQQVRVLNGARASVRLAQALPLQWWQVVWTPQGPQALPSTQWAEAVRGFVVQPAWAGGEQPVRVEISTEGGAPGRVLDGSPPPASRVLTTVEVPLGQWVTVASSSDATQSSERGVLSSREARRTQQLVVELRVTAP
jgi:hypothetical protein